MKTLTKEELEKLGFYKINSLLKKDRYQHERLGEVTIYLSYNHNDLFDLFYKKGSEDGIRKGAKEKADEIKRCLNIYVD